MIGAEEHLSFGFYDDETGHLSPLLVVNVRSCSFANWLVDRLVGVPSYIYGYIP